MAKNIAIIGTGHVFRLREKVKKLIEDINPHAVCVELDEERCRALLHERKSLNPLFSPLAFTQAAMAHVYDTTPGNDMLGAIEGARDIKAELFLIDKDIVETKKRLYQAFRSEFFNPLELLRKLIFSPYFLLSQARFSPSFEAAVEEFERNPEKYRRLLGMAFATFKKALLDEREEYMAERVKEILKDFDKIAIVTGAGHVFALRKLLADYDIEVFSLTGLLKDEDIGKSPQ
jgi:pheromone shutdown protein TraB